MSPRDRKFYRSRLVYLALISFFGVGFTLIGWYLRLGMILYQWVAVLVLSMLMFVPLIFARFDITKWLPGIWGLLVLAAFTANVMTMQQMIQLNVPFDSFTTFRLVSLATAFIEVHSIPLRMGVIASGGIIPVLVYYLMFPAAVQATLPGQEPWINLVVMVISFGILYNQTRLVDLEVQIGEIEWQKRSMKRLAQTFISFRDLINTPLQTIQFSADLLKQGDVDRQEVADYLDKSIEKLTQISATLRRYEDNIDWDRKPPGSLDEFVTFMDDALDGNNATLGQPKTSPSP